MHVSDGNSASFGVVIRDETRLLLLAAAAAAVKKIVASWPPFLAETGAAKYGLEIARRIAYDNVILEGDAINIVRAIQERQEGATTIFLIF